MSDNVIDLASRRLVSMWAACDHEVAGLVGTCLGPDDQASDPDSRVCLKAPPDGCLHWSLTPEQARRVARDLIESAGEVEARGER